MFESAGGEVRAALEKLKQFLCVDNDAIPHVVVSDEDTPTCRINKPLYTSISTNKPHRVQNKCC